MRRRVLVRIWPVLEGLGSSDGLRKGGSRNIEHRHDRIGWHQSDCFYLFTEPAAGFSRRLRVLALMVVEVYSSFRPFFGDFSCGT